MRDPFTRGKLRRRAKLIGVKGQDSKRIRIAIRQARTVRG